MLAIFLSVACPLSLAQIGPNHDELLAAIRGATVLASESIATASELRDIKCRGFEEDPTEYLCKFQAKRPSGKWQTATAIVAIDGKHWVLLSVE